MQYDTMKYRALLIGTALLTANLYAQTCNRDTIPASTPMGQFSVNTDETVIDDKHGLMWKRCAEGLSGTDCATGTGTSYNWQQALQTAEASTFAGYSDWRVPNIKELATLVDEQCSGPAINTWGFPGTDNTGFWSSSPMSTDSDMVYGIIDFTTGNIADPLRDPSGETVSRQGSRFLRLVRDI
jgi:hypothetical protein